MEKSSESARARRDASVSGAKIWERQRAGQESRHWDAEIHNTERRVSHLQIKKISIRLLALSLVTCCHRHCCSRPASPQPMLLACWSVSRSLTCCSTWTDVATPAWHSPIASPHRPCSCPQLISPRQSPPLFCHSLVIAFSRLRCWYCHWVFFCFLPFSVWTGLIRVGWTNSGNFFFKKGQPEGSARFGLRANGSGSRTKAHIGNTGYRFETPCKKTKKILWLCQHHVCICVIIFWGLIAYNLKL